VVDTGRIGDDQGRSRVCFCFFDCIQELGLVRTDGHLRYINISIREHHCPQVFFPYPFPCGGELGHGAHRGSFGRLSAGIGIDFRIENQNVDILSGCHDVVKSAVTNIIGPSVSSEDPDGFLDEVLFQIQDLPGVFLHFALQKFHHTGGGLHRFFCI